MQGRIGIRITEVLTEPGREKILSTAFTLRRREFHQEWMRITYPGVIVMPDRVGQQLGNYRLIRLLGSGGFAEVYLGTHLYLKSYAALKVLSTRLEDTDVDQFLAEAQTLARLAHPFIVRVLEFAVEHDGTPFLVMDYAPRGALRGLHPNGSCLSLEGSAAYLRPIAAALQYAHNHQVIHRDVKPENLLLGSQQEILLSDFGISLFAPSREHLRTQGFTGTLAYMAPEQTQGQPCFASDQYALGIVVYEWLCGRRPFEGPALQVAYQHAAVLPPRLREQDPSLPQAVEDVVLKALAKDPRERYVSVELFAQAFERACRMSRHAQIADIATDHLAPLAPSRAATSRRVLLLGSPAFNTLRDRLAADLQQRGTAIWDATPEEDDDLRQAIRATDVVVLVASPLERGVSRSLRIASLYQRRLVYVWTAGEDIAPALVDERGNRLQVELVDAREKPYSQVLSEVSTCLETADALAEPMLPGPPEQPRNPYKGLRAFTQNDATDFFGRDRLIEELVDRVKNLFILQPPGAPPARLLTLLGPSGSGKSSMVMAGLLPRLQRGALPGSERWLYLEPVMPGAHPLEALTLALAPHFPERGVQALREILQDEPARGLNQLAPQLMKSPEQRLVLFIDQFEEVFALATPEEERRHFIALLVNAATERRGPTIVILTLRADFYDRPMAYPGLHRLVEACQVSVLPMEAQDLRAVMKGPAALPDVHLAFEGNLVGDLLYEIQDQPGALPLLQFTLEQLFARRKDHVLTLRAYAEIGGVRGALAKQAEATYAALPSEGHRKLARALFLRLIDPGLTEQDTTRRRAALSELSLPDPAQTELLQETVQSFIAARLLTASTITGTPTVEVSHEALIREWPRLSQWLREAREDMRLQQSLSRDVAAWEQHSRPPDRLYRGAQLREARKWAQRNIPSTHEVAFLRAGATRRTRSLAGLLALLLLLGSATGIAGWFFLHQPPNFTRVTTLQDSGVGSLRWAIANALAGSTITFAPGVKGTIRLTSADLTLTRSLTVRGPGANLLTITSGKSGYRVVVLQGVTASILGISFEDSSIPPPNNASFVSNSFVVNDGTLTLTSSIVSGNINSPGGIGFGGGITNFGTLTLINSIVSHNLAQNGGGIANNGSLALINSTISGNTAPGGGGGIAINVSDGTTTLIHSIVSNNAGQAQGGGIENIGKLTLNDSTVRGNTAMNGGGIDNESTGQLTLINSTISGNRASDATHQQGIGGGVWENGAGKLVLVNSTISDNTASSNGGGIDIANALADISFCTIYGNTATGGKGGGIATEYDSTNSQQPTQVQMGNSLVVGNHAPTAPDIAGTLITTGYNLISNFSGITFNDPQRRHTTDLLGTRFPSLAIDPLLRANGGPTQTHALLLKSPAIDVIPLRACRITVDGVAITTDQRGVKRPQGKGCDIGAYEYQPSS